MTRVNARPSSHLNHHLVILVRLFLCRRINKAIIVCHGHVPPSLRGDVNCVRPVKRVVKLYLESLEGC